MYRILATAMVTVALMTGCGGSQPAAPVAPAAPAAAAPAAAAEVPAMRNFAAVKIGPYDVQPMFEEEIVNGHYNIKVSDGEVKAVRGWVGPEDASGVMVVKTEIENDYHHGHFEVPNPVPADAKLWIEIESPTGRPSRAVRRLLPLPASAKAADRLARGVRAGAHRKHPARRCRSRLRATPPSRRFARES
jgi:hypothetical protein